MSVVVDSKKKALKKKKAPVVKKTFSLQPNTWSWLSQFSNKSEVVNKALEEYYYRNARVAEYDIETLWENMENYKKRVGYVSDEEQKEIEEILGDMSDEEKEIVISSTSVYTL